MANKPKSPAQVAAARKVAVEQQKVNAMKKQKTAPVVAKKTVATVAKPKMKTVTGSAVKVTASKPGMKKVTGQAVTVTGKRPVNNTAPSNKVYLVKKGGQNVEVTQAEYNATKGPKDYVYLNEAGQPLQKGSGGTVNSSLVYSKMNRKKKM